MDYEKPIITVTVYDFLQMKKMKGVQMVKDTGLSQAMVSKLKLNQTTLTKKTKELLQKTYPGYLFTANGLDANWIWKDRYYHSLEIIKQQKQQIQKLEEKVNLSRKAKSALQILINEL